MKLQVGLLVKSFMLFLITSIIFLGIVIGVDYSNNYRLAQDAELRDLDIVSISFNSELTRIEDSIAALSRSKESFDSVMSKKDRVSRLFYNVMRMDSSIVSVRLVSGDEIFGDPFVGVSDVWLKSIESSKDVSWSPLYKTDKGLWVKDVSFPVMYNGGVVGQVFYTVAMQNSVDRSLVDNDFSIVMDGVTIFSTVQGREGTLYDYSIEDGKLSTVSGKSVVYTERDDVRIYDVLDENKWLYLSLALFFTMGSLMITWIAVSQFRSHIEWMGRFIESVRNGDITSLRKGYVSRNLNELDYIEDGIFEVTSELLNDRSLMVDYRERLVNLDSELESAKVVGNQLREFSDGMMKKAKDFELLCNEKDEIIVDLSERIDTIKSDVEYVLKEFSEYTDIDISHVLSKLDEIRKYDTDRELYDVVTEVTKKMNRMTYTVMHVISMLHVREVEASNNLDDDMYNFVIEMRRSLQHVVSDMGDVDVIYDELFKTWRNDKTNSKLMKEMGSDLELLRLRLQSYKISIGKLEREIRNISK